MTVGEKNCLEETGGFKKIIQDHNDRFERRQDKIKLKSEMREDDLISPILHKDTYPMNK